MEKDLDLISKAEELGRCLRESDIYKEYVQAKQKLYEDEALAGRVREYVKRNFYIQNYENGNKSEDIHNLQNDFKDILRNTVARDYLNAELVLCKTIKQINCMIISDIDFNVDFIL